MRQVTNPSQGRFCIELTQDQAIQALTALAIYNRFIEHPNETGAEIMSAVKVDTHFDPYPVHEGIEKLTEIIGDNLVAVRLGTSNPPFCLYVPINDDEFGESGEVIQLHEGESLQIEPS